MKRFCTAGAALALVTAFTPALAKPVNPTDLIAQGKYEQARQVLRQMTQSHPTQAQIMALLEARILRHQGKPKQAAAAYRAILDKSPDFMPARRELFLILHQMGHQQGAVFHAERLMMQTRDDRLRNGLQGYVLRNQGGPDHGASLRFSIQPTTNVTNSTNQKTVLIGGREYAVDQTAQSGVEIGIGGTVWKSWELSGQWKGTGVISADIYRTTGTDSTDGIVSLSYRLTGTTPQTQVSFAPFVERRFSDGDVLRNRAGLSINGAWIQSPQTMLQYSLMGAKQTYPDLTYRDGHLIRGSVGMRYRFDPTLSMSFAVNGEREETKRDHLDRKNTGIKADVSKAWASGLYTTLFASYNIDQYQGTYPGTDTRRRDKIARAGVSMRYPKFTIGKFTPELTISHTRNASNIALQEYDSTDVMVGFSQRF